MMNNGRDVVVQLGYASEELDVLVLCRDDLFDYSDRDLPFIDRIIISFSSRCVCIRHRTNLINY